MNLECPLPQLDFDTITMGHGSGGVLTQRLLNQCIFQQLKNPYLEKEDDAAILELSDKLAFSTDSFVVTPIFYPGGNIGDLAVNGTVNDVAVSGAVPKFISLSLIIEEGLKVQELWDILVSIKQACEKAGVMVVTGDTKVVERGKGDKIFINTTGIGEVIPDTKLDIDHIRFGDKVIVTGPIASHGTTILSTREGLGIDSDIITDSAPLNHLIVDVLKKFGEEIHFIRDATRGGLAAVLNEVVKYNDMGITINQKDIPVLPAVQDLCEILGLDPLYVANEGVAVFFVSSSHADLILRDLQKMEFGTHANIIGEVTGEPSNRVLLQSEIGGRRVVHMPLAEQLPRIC